ncbi:polysaccharide biosynthesis protein [Tissierella creatinini]|nr:polysaccharide biosynthesis protein [Tissierella creatinini]TJX60535.1 polysaccharide biosynthesis protein [Soehngenia saccharolytica]
MNKKKLVFFVLLDIISISLSYYFALLLRFEGKPPNIYLQFYYDNIIPITLIKLTIFYFFNLHKSLWKYASIDELLQVLVAVIMANMAMWGYFIITSQTFSRSLSLLIGIMELSIVGGIRFLYRMLRLYIKRFGNKKKSVRTLIVGAGSAGVMILKELRDHESLNAAPVAFIDDDPKKQGTYINGVRVVGKRNDIVWAVNKYDVDEIIIAIPSASTSQQKDILNICKNTKVKTKTLPGIYEIIDGNVNVNYIRDVQIEDLLGREEVKLDIDEVSDFIESKVIMVTGGGGSIGSELCRQIAGYKPKELVIVDIYENNLYDIQMELLRTHKDLNLNAIIASVRDGDRIDEIIKATKPNIIFHAAAHKHVPLMENNPKDAIKNNVLGTLNVVKAADKYKVDKFVFISTDKAVNPTNVMGATKRFAEMIIQSYDSISDTDFVAVRFGNVLGSNGSVIPLFKKQIAEGGPVTVTDERIIRFFMTIPEACNLVLEAGAMATGGEIFVLDMGEPVKIIDLARDLIRLSGFEPDVDIPIEITGLRPGEKLYEEILIDKNTMLKTKNNKIFVEKPMEFKYDTLIMNIERITQSIEKDSIMDIKYNLARIIPSYTPYNEVIMSPTFSSGGDILVNKGGVS